ncbi:hypothetical protein F0L17_00675 [Streptomyces sp. TRM43335]|uniref:Uncharacterized protein n=1 Tax=Streptomyces taklimakanensis TaxID=2569853 RepID=A0A6G2B6H0_9ACTN|nr:hypothetical protein [Streptomyces taklimakanensis]
MVGTTRTFELFRFADTVQSVTAEVRCGEPPTMGDERYYAAEIVLKSDFVTGRVDLWVSLEDLDEWERCLDTLQAEEGVEWPAGGRGAWLAVLPEDPVEVTVHDSPSTQIAVRVPIDVASDWLEENRLRLDHVRKAVAPAS